MPVTTNQLCADQSRFSISSNFRVQIVSFQEVIQPSLSQLFFVVPWSLKKRLGKTSILSISPLVLVLVTVLIAAKWLKLLNCVNPLSTMEGWRSVSDHTAIFIHVNGDICQKWNYRIFKDAQKYRGNHEREHSYYNQRGSFIGDFGVWNILIKVIFQILKHIFHDIVARHHAQNCDSSFSQPNEARRDNLSEKKFVSVPELEHKRLPSRIAESIACNSLVC